MNQIKITHILWRKRAIGVSLRKLVDGLNEIKITVKDKANNRLYPDPIVISREKLLNIYSVETINKSGLQGVFIPLIDIERRVFNA